ncbi:translocase of chloroplast 132, chloroplastic-like [Euphorbia lathyris]|uniref:translocase of chloroplast 132, chloroplastic-like n=1 Tax=Euphorbia lathyris TaxID=212925 RepID=UPI00331402D0
MENGVERASGPDLGEENHLEHQVAGDKVEERVAVESDRMLDNEEEVFEEAVDTPDQFLNQDANSESGVSVEATDYFTLAMVDENLKVETELEAFQEAMDIIPASPGYPEDITAVLGEEKGTYLLDGESVDKIDEGGTAKQVVSNELSGGKEVSEIGSNGSTEVLQAEVEVNSSHEIEPSPEFLPELNGEKVVSETGLNGGSEVLKDEVEVNSSHESVPSAESPPQLNGEKEVYEIGLNGGTEVLKAEVELNSSHESVPSAELPLQNGEKEVSEIGLSGSAEVLKAEVEVNCSHESVPSAELPPQNGEKEVPEIGLSGSAEVLKAEVEVNSNQESVPSAELPPQNGEKEVSEVGRSGSAEVEVKSDHEIEPSVEFLPVFVEEEVKEDKLVTQYPGAQGSVEVKVPLDLQEHKVEDLNGNLPKLDTECQVIEKSSELERETVVLDYANGVHETEQLDDSASLDLEHHNDSNGDVKATTVLVEAGLCGKTDELNASAAGLRTVSESEMSNSQVEKFVNEISEVFQSREVNIRAVDDKDSDPTCTDEKVISVDKDSIVIEEQEKKVETQQEKQSTQRSAEKKALPPVKLAPSPEKSTASAPPPARPAGLGRAAPLLEPAPRAVQQQQRVNGTMSHAQSQQIEDPANGESEELDETREKLQMIRVKFLRLAHRLGQTPHNVVVAQVLYRLGLAEQLRGRNGGRVGAFSFDRASAMAEQLEAAGQEPLDFSCTIMVLGKTGVGKSATINSIFDEVKFGTDAFQLGTKKVQDVVGTVQGIKVRVIDTPGLLPSGSDQRQNEKILHSVKRFIKKTPPDIVLYLDRLDMQSRDFGDMPLLRTITEIFGPSIWFNAIVVLTHAASAPPDGPNGTASSYDMFVTQRSHVVQQAIRQAAGDMRLMNPVSLVENHSACRTNRAGQRVLPNGQVWKPHLLLLSFASKILAEANTLLKLQDSPPGKPFATRSRAPPLPFLLSSLLQSRPPVKLPEEQYGDEDSLDDDLEESSDSEDESEYDDLPPFRSLTKDQISKLTKAQKKAYFDELEYREKLFMKKQLKEEKRRRRMMKKMAAAVKELPSDYNDNAEEESGGASSVPVPMPDLALPASFDSDNPTHRYRYLDTSNQWLVRPVLETHGWDHDVGYEGINVERLFVVKDKVPLSFSGQVTKDKKDANVQMEFASSLKHGEGKSTSLGFDMQTVGKDLAYTLRSETKFCNFRKNKASAGLSLTLLGDALSAGLKVEDKLIANKRFQMVVSGGAMTGRGDVAYGGSLEAQLRDEDYPLGRSLSTLGLSVMDWHGDLAIGCNVQSQIPMGRSTNLIARGNLNNRGAGQISIRVNSSEQLQIALIGLLPLLKKVFAYPQQMQFGQ